MKLRWLFLPVLSVIFGVAAQPALAQASCIENCQNSCPSYNDPYNSRSECTNNCVSRCSPGGSDYSRPSGPAAPYGAIAYGADSGASGWAYNQDSAAKADQVALTNCAPHGGDCRIVIRLTHSCGAVAAGAGDTVIARPGQSQQEAEDAALSACRTRAGKSCEIQAWTCSP